MNKLFFLGIDIGSVTISIVKIDIKKQIIQSSYIFHEGQIVLNLKNELSNYNLSNINAVAVTSSTPKIIKTPHRFDNRVCFIHATKKMHPDAEALLIVGGEKFGLALFDSSGNYRNFKANSSCAAGTGSFLDQQSRRLNINSIHDFSELAYNNKGNYPKIASRCAVFSKTDLIHAQQEGYNLAEICDGVCFGLAKNIIDTVFTNVTGISKLVFAGGVSQNKAVVKHIRKITGIHPITNEFGHLFGAYGAVLNYIQENQNNPLSLNLKKIDDLIVSKPNDKSYFNEELTLKLSEYPEFTSWKSFLRNSSAFTGTTPIEVDLYSNFNELSDTKVYLGIDVGSTSTKAVLMDNSKNVLAGFYTRTSGQPVIAIQTIFETIYSLENKYKLKFNIESAGTTGSGRKFVGKIIGAEEIIDEISAHARAAIELDPDVDTIIEIGGQDSKFTTLSHGIVTFSVMNNVCAAGTGSFIEEQAIKLGVSLTNYSERAEKKKSPLASDRCTVFMERDLSHYLNEGYEIDEILASVLHSVRENYLSKVAVGRNLGKKIFFQGATAKNRALVASFEQKLGKPILVSKYCHLTGALGVALNLFDHKIVSKKFRGLQLFTKQIPVSATICDLCNNHCKLQMAEIDGITEAYGFLCGRDFNDEKFIDNNTSGFNLIKSYKKIFRYSPKNETMKGLVMGIPAALYLWDDLLMWKIFFNQLKIKIVTSENCLDAVKNGKNFSGAEFCAPIIALHGHIMHLAGKADYLFMPVYLEENQKNSSRLRQYCYYSQYASAIVNSIAQNKIKLISPVLYSKQNTFMLKLKLYNSLKDILPKLSILDISNAYDEAKRITQQRKAVWEKTFNDVSTEDDNLKVVLLGRPYTVLSSAMNSKIPEIFSKLGVKTFFQDMLPVAENEAAELVELLDAFKWKYAAEIVISADYVAKTDNLYPVLITSFKCTPDSFVIEYFKQILNVHKKPYLILQLDENDSSVGYETRIEAALRSFKNHKGSHQQKSKTVIHFAKNNIIQGVLALENKTLLVPNWDDYVCRLLVSAMCRSGIDARLLKDTPSSIQRSLVLNTGQCIPLNIILQDAIDYIEEHNLNPADTALWMVPSTLACNFSMFPHYISKLLQTAGNGFSKLNVFVGEVTFFDFSFNAAVNAYLAYMFGGYIRKIVCKIRPYEVIKGETDRIAEKALSYMSKKFKNGESKEEALKKIVAWFEIIKIIPGEKPKVAIFGDLYVRDNDVLNQDLIRIIEQNGGEAVTTPYSEYLKIISFPYMKRLFKDGNYRDVATLKFFRVIIPLIEGKYYKHIQEIINEPLVEYVEGIEKKLSLFNVKISNGGESMDNLLKIFHLAKQHPDLTLFVQTNPAYCCPSLVTQSMAGKIEKLTGIPIVNIEYDGTHGRKNEDIIPFLKFARKEKTQDI